MRNPQDLDSLCINTIRTLSIDCIQKANSGHPGLPMGAAPMAYVLWQNHLRHNPKNPAWANRDRFILSPGHGSMLLYSLLHLTGYDLSLEELKNFRQWGSKTPGHPEVNLTPGVEATTGPLGQGSVNAIGMAIAERAQASLFNQDGFDIVNHFTYALVSDGDLMEGLSAEGASIAGHLKLGKLIYLYDSNDVTLDGPASLTFTDDTARRYEAYGWQVQTVKDGNTDLTGLNEAILKARADLTRPSLIIVKTTIGFGSPNKQGKSASHGSPLGPDEIKLTKKSLGWDPDAQFLIPADAKSHFENAIRSGTQAEREWNELFDSYSRKFPKLAEQWALSQKGELPAGWDQTLTPFKSGEALATRESSGKVLNSIAAQIPWLIGGDADLSCSTNTYLKDLGAFEGVKGTGRNIHYGVREHAMGAIANGIAYHGGLKTFTATFLAFADYMRPAIRLAAMNHLPVVFVFTHDSIGLGEDGPTHQPVEHVTSLRSIPNLWVLRPADSSETLEAWKIAIARKDGPVALILSRQKLVNLDRNLVAPASGVQKGAYVLSEAKSNRPSGVLISTGSEVHIALEAQALLAQKGIGMSVVSMPSWELFERQDLKYREQVLPPHASIRVSIEAGITLGWSRYTGEKGIQIGVDRYGASAPAPILYEKYGLTAKNICQLVELRLAGV